MEKKVGEILSICIAVVRYNLLVTVEALATQYLIHGWEKDRVIYRNVQLNVTGMTRAKRISQVASLAKSGRLVKRSHVLIIEAAAKGRMNMSVPWTTNAYLTETILTQGLLCRLHPRKNGPES